jgi:hypothetical protein
MNVQVRASLPLPARCSTCCVGTTRTRGVLQLQKVGPWKYAADNYTEVLCCAFCEQQFYSPNCPPRAGAMSEPMPTCKAKPAIDGVLP